MEFINLINMDTAMDYILSEAKKQHLSQTKLAEGVCDVGNLNKIINKKDGRKLNYDYLFKFCNKLNVSMKSVAINTYFSDPSFYTKLCYAKTYYYDYNFTALEELLEELNEHPDANLPYSRMHLLWYEACIDYYVKRSFATSANKCMLALTEIHPNFIISQASIRLLSKDELVILYQYFLCNIMLQHTTSIKEYCLYIIELLNSEKSANRSIAARFYLLIALIDEAYGDIESSLKYVEKGIQCERSGYTIRTLPYLLFVGARCLFFSKRYEESLQSINIAINLLTLYNPTHSELDVFKETKEKIQNALAN